jgi:hypothetical protein
MHCGFSATLAVLGTCAGCASELPPTPAAPEAPNAPSRSSRLDGDAPRAGTGDAEFVQEERPEGCLGSDQPAIVALEDSGSSHVPVWRCFLGCGPGLEYVSVIRHHHGDRIRIDCHPICPSGTHRAEYATSKREPGLSCAPGDPQDAAWQRLAADQERQRRTCVEARRAALAGAEQEVARAERDPAFLPSARQALATVPKMCDGRREPTYYGWNAEDAYPIERERVLAIAAPELVAQSRSLGARVDRVSVAAKKLAERTETQAKERAAEAERKLAPCYLSCDASRTRCRGACAADITWGACSACEASLAECRRTCAERVDATPANGI